MVFLNSYPPDLRVPWIEGIFGIWVSYKGEVPTLINKVSKDPEGKWSLSPILTNDFAGEDVGSKFQTLRAEVSSWDIIGLQVKLRAPRQVEFTSLVNGSHRRIETWEVIGPIYVHLKY